MMREGGKNRDAEHYDDKNSAVALSSQPADCGSHQLREAGLMKSAADDEYARDDNGRFARKARQSLGRTQNSRYSQSKYDQDSDNVISEPLGNQQSECDEQNNEEADLLDGYVQAASLLL
jgi:hypothetical protein